MGSPFKVGDIVELKSGGPPMTVTEVHTNLVGHSEIKCQWFFGMMWTGTFTPDALIPSRPRKFEELNGSYSGPVSATTSPESSEEATR
jgi:uncharacterized protein YodC (DUF2158 family)